MKLLRGLVTTFLLLIIIGGVGYIVYNTYYVPRYGHFSIAPPLNNQHENVDQESTNNQADHNNMNTDNVIPNTISIINQDRLNNAISTINKAVEQITIDPYASTTIPNVKTNKTQQATAGTGTINIYPGGSSSVNVIPPTENPASNNQTLAGVISIDPNTNYVYDQDKLQQLHKGIYTLAQGLMLMDELSNDLSNQANLSEKVPATYQTYITRYNIALQNKTKLNNIIGLLDQATVLINVNPYGGPEGYQIRVDRMNQLHQGIYQLAQGMALLNRLSESFTEQMLQAAQLAGVSAGNASVVNDLTGSRFFNFNISSIFTTILIIMIIGFLLGIFGAVISMFRGRVPEKR